MNYPVCGFVCDGRRCRRRGPHRCLARVRHVLGFFRECLVHTKGDWHGRPFVPAAWQRDRVLAPLFGDVIFDERRRRYVRRYRLLYLSVARKNGKTELLAGIVLYLLVADGEHGAEIYGLALDISQAGLVYHVASRMVRLSKALSGRLTVLPSTGRIVDETTGSYYAVIASDADGTLGLNPSGGYIDELLTQPSRDLYDALRTGLGARAQPLLMLSTTAEADESSFAATERKWSERVAKDPRLEPERLVVIYSADAEADWTQPATWRQANPALGDYLEYRVLAAECHTAQANPVEERAFRQYRLNQPTPKVGRAIDMAAWAASAGPLGAKDLPGHLAGQRCYVGLDLSATQDLAAYALVFPEGSDDGAVSVIWRHFVPAAALGKLAQRTAGQANLWVGAGWLTVTEGNVLDYGAVKVALAADRDRYQVQEVAFDPWGAIQFSSELVEEGWPMFSFAQAFSMMAGPTGELLRLVGQGRFHHGANPLVDWEAGNAVTRGDAQGRARFDKARSQDKVDGLVAAVMGLDRAIRHAQPAKDYAAAGW